jgi:hypothetical protein
MLRDRGLADRVITALLDSGVPSSEISLAAREEAGEDVTERDEADATEFRDLATHSAWERLGWQGGARPPYRDKVAPDIEMAFVAAGPLAIAIGGAQLGACSGGMVGSMNNFGFPLDLTKQWYERLVQGQSWVMVRTSEDQKDRALQLFQRHNADLLGVSIRHW